MTTPMCPQCGAPADLDEIIAHTDQYSWHLPSCPIRQEALRVYNEDAAWLAAHPGDQRWRLATGAEKLSAAARLQEPLDVPFLTATAIVSLQENGRLGVAVSATTNPSAVLDQEKPT